MLERGLFVNCFPQGIFFIGRLPESISSTFSFIGDGIPQSAHSLYTYLDYIFSDEWSNS